MLGDVDAGDQNDGGGVAAAEALDELKAEIATLEELRRPGAACGDPAVRQPAESLYAQLYGRLQELYRRLTAVELVAAASPEIERLRLERAKLEIATPVRNGRWYNPRFWKDLQRAVVELSPAQKLLAAASIGSGANLRQASPSPDVLEEAVDQARQRLLTEADLATEWEALKTREQVESLHSDKRGLRRSSRTAVRELAQKLPEGERPHSYTRIGRASWPPQGS